jgi:hypothetical protein
MPITVTIDDPATIQLLTRYRQFIAQEDNAEGTLDQAAEGLILGCLDEHHRFNVWCQDPATQAFAKTDSAATISTPLLPRRLSCVGR